MQQRKQYDFTASPFYNLKSKHKLAEILNLSLSELDKVERIANTPSKSYAVFTVGEKKREIQNPIHPLLRKTQTRIFTLLSRFCLPDYVHSGRKGHSFITNAKVHCDSTFILTMDIEHFYASTRGEVAYQFFYHKMHVAKDLSHILTNISTFSIDGGYKRKVPTGSCLSQTLAFWIYSDMFDNINSIAQNNNLIFSLYVDDMTFSSKNKIPKDFHKKIEEQLRKRWLRFKRSKVRYYSATEYKKVTGVIITPANKMEVPNKNLKNASHIIGKALSPTATQTEKTRALGVINSIQQISPEKFGNVKTQI